MKKFKPFATDYRPGSQSFAAGFLGPMGNVGYIMELDLKKVRSILETLEQKDISKIEIGLDGDFNENGQEIEIDFKDEDIWIYDRSIWATPILIVSFRSKPNNAYEVFKKIN